MAQKTFNLSISRVDGPIFSGKALSVSVPGVAGDMMILADHEPLVTPLRAGTVHYVTADGEAHTVETMGGTLETAHNHTTILL